MDCELVKIFEVLLKNGCYEVHYPSRISMQDCMEMGKLCRFLGTTTLVVFTAGRHEFTISSEPENTIIGFMPGEYTEE
jgi:hypothetical protein